MKGFFSQAALLFLVFASAEVMQGQKGTILHQTNDYTIFSDGARQGTFTAQALSATELVSNYQSPKNESVSSKIEFKFSINGKDNEMEPGLNHWFNLSGTTETPLIKFGEPLKMNDSKEVLLQPNTPLKVRLDLRTVCAEIKTKGYYTTFKGDQIFKADFKHVYIAGATAPLTWDFDNLHQKPELEMKDPDGDGIYETTIIFNSKKDQKTTDGLWKMTKNAAIFPQYQSNQVLADAIYNLSLEEMINAVEPDGTFRTGKEWAGVWTRDISYSIILSMAYLQPQVAMNSLRRKVSASKRIIQDTGTGGAYPCSTDRAIWATAAWEVYKATGDRKWLEGAFEIIKNSVNDDVLVAYDQKTGLVRGESSFLDWREQTYPKWMQPADIFESQNLGTNAVHYQANIVLADMAKILGQVQVEQQSRTRAEAIKNGINQYLWMPKKGYYAQYLYGRNYKIQSPRAEALGEALCILFGIADAEKATSIVSKTPVTAFGIPCIYPQIPGLPPYHNDAVWPFVQSYWAMASAKAAHEKSVMESIAAIYRPAALFLTNKENFVAGNGDFAGTVINSSNMLWSLSGNIAMVHKLLFGIELQADRLVFHPFVPKALEGKRTLRNFKYRNAILDISMEGFGQLKTFMVDGKPSSAEILANLTGQHTIAIILNNQLSSSTINKVDNYFSPETPLVTLGKGFITWQNVPQAVKYLILENGNSIGHTNLAYHEFQPGEYTEFQVIAVDANGVESFASEPIAVSDPLAGTLFEIENFTAKATYPYKGFLGDGFVETSKTVNPTIEITVDIKESTNYAIDFRYANGNGPTNTENKCAIRSLKENGQFLGTFVFPQRGVQEWSNWGFSNRIKVFLQKGKHTFTLSLDATNENMNGDINQAMLDCIRVTKLERVPF